MDLKDLQPILDLQSNMEERLVKKIDEMHGAVKETRDELKRLNGTVSQHQSILDKNIPHTIVHCAQADTIDEIKRAVVIGATEKDIEKQRKVERHNSSILRISLASIMIIGLLGVYNAFTNRITKAQGVRAEQLNIQAVQQNDTMNRYMRIIEKQVKDNTEKINNFNKKQ